MADRGAGAAAERMRRIGVLMNFLADDPESQASRRRLAAGIIGVGLDVGPQWTSSHQMQAPPRGQRLVRQTPSGIVD